MNAREIEGSSTKVRALTEAGWKVERARPKHPIHSVDHARSGPAASKWGQLWWRTRRVKYLGGEKCCPAGVGKQGGLQTVEPLVWDDGGSNRRSFQDAPQPTSTAVGSWERRSLRSTSVYASLLMRTELGTETHSIEGNTPSVKGLEAWRRLAYRFDPASAQANLNSVGRIPKHPQGTCG